MGYLTASVGGMLFDGSASGNAWIDRDGLDGWWDSAETTTDDEVVPGRDGELDTLEPYVGARRFTFRAIVESSTPDWAELHLRPWAAALSKSPDIEFGVLHAGRWLYLRRAQTRGRVRIRPHRDNLRRTTIEMVIKANDPRKYGRTLPIEIDALVEADGGLTFPIVDRSMSFSAGGLVQFPGVFQIHNPGTAEFYPERFIARGPLDSFTITSESHTVEYDGPLGHGDELVLTPYAGGRATLNGVDVSHNLIHADWVAVQPGETRGFMFSPENPQPGSSLTVEYPEGAYW